MRQSGAGIGLSLVKSLIELHGGTVVIESASEEGTRITCRLPLAQRATYIPAASQSHPQPLTLAVPAP